VRWDAVPFLLFGLSKPIGESRRADSNRLPLLQLRVITQALQGFAGDCKCSIFRGVSFLYLAECCTVLRSRWCQCGVRRRCITPHLFLYGFERFSRLLEAQGRASG
jgi:hypothetical protein